MCPRSVPKGLGLRHLKQHIRQLIVEVLEIAQETGWRGPERHVKLQWDWRGGIVDHIVVGDGTAGYFSFADEGIL